MAIFLFIAGFVILITGANLLIEGSTSIGRRLRIPDLIVGLTIVALGTSLPELVINIFASAQDQTDLAISNVLGSNIINILVIVGFMALIRPITITGQTTSMIIPVSLSTTILLGIFVWRSIIYPGDVDTLNRWEGIVFVVLISFYLYFSIKTSIKKDDKSEDERKQILRWWIKPLAFIIAGLAGLYFGGEWIVGGAKVIAGLIGISESVVGLTIVASASSLPELVTSIIALRKNKGDLAVGNAIGSCTFNILFVLGISSIITPLPFNRESIADFIIVLFANILMFTFVFTGKGRLISRFEGALMLLSYGGFMFYVFS